MYYTLLKIIAKAKDLLVVVFNVAALAVTSDPPSFNPFVPS
jgi:hypothetical protein